VPKLLKKMTKRTEHCSFAKINPYSGHCIANCHERHLVAPGISEDCTGKRSETIKEYKKRVEENKDKI
jgi:hypothetical protein